MDLSTTMQLESLRSTAYRKSEVKAKRLSANDIARIAIRASHKRDQWLAEKVKSKEFILAEIPLSSVAIVDSFGELEIQASLDDTPIIVDVNKNKIGRTTGRRSYVPKVIVIEGAARHNAYRLSGSSLMKAWVGAEAAVILGLMADHQFGSDELRQKLGELLREKYVPKKKNGETIGPYPYISEVYPFENYFVYSYDANLYKQAFTCDIKKRQCKFDGDPEQVVQKFVELGKDVDATKKQTSMEKTLKMAAMPSVAKMATPSRPGNAVGTTGRMPMSRPGVDTTQTSPRFINPNFKANSVVQRTKPFGNVASKKDGFTYNRTSPGSGVGPRVFQTGRKTK